ncbi:MAG: VWA domain-containing protein [Bacteroidales bacterium]
MKKKIITGGIFIFFFFQVFPQNNALFKPKITRILFVFDCSQSMYAQWGNDTRINIARDIFLRLVDSLSNVPFVEMGLRVYGHQSPVPPQDCNDSKLEVPFAPNNATQIRQKMRMIYPKGTTPIARSLELAGGDFPYDPNAKNIIILITDGIEACDGDPCVVSESLQGRGIILKPFVIGIGLELDLEKYFDCVGRVLNAQHSADFPKVLKMAVSEALNSTTAQVNLLDSKGNPTETDVTMTFYDKATQQVKYNFVHTLNKFSRPDTIVLDPVPIYNLVVHTLPPVTKNNIEISPGMHNTISLNTPQGQLLINKPTTTLYTNLQFLVKKAGSSEIINVQNLNQVEKYICGKYDIEILTLPRISLKNIDINQSATTTLEIPAPGQVTLIKTAPGKGGIYVVRNNQLQFVTHFNPLNKGNESFVLQPGTYIVVYRPINVNNINYSIERKFIIKSGSVEQIKL